MRWLGGTAACTWLLVALLASSASCAADPGEGALRYIDIAHPSVSQRVDSGTAGLQGAKFVNVEVAEVTNPGKYGLAFDVFFEPAGGSRVRLGTFSLFPADNPGKFIVPTQGKVNGAGSIVVAMQVTDKPAAGVPVKVGIGKIAVSSGQP